MTIIDIISIAGMKQTDFMQLQEIFNHMMEDGTYWGRKDYWDERNKRLAKWLEEVNQLLIGSRIKGIR